MVAAARGNGLGRGRQPLREVVERPLGESRAPRVAVVDHDRRQSGVRVQRGGHAPDVPPVRGGHERQHPDRCVLGGVRRAGDVRLRDPCPGEAARRASSTTRPWSPRCVAAGRAGAAPMTSPLGSRRRNEVTWVCTRTAPNDTPTGPHQVDRLAPRGRTRSPTARRCSSPGRHARPWRSPARGPARTRRRCPPGARGRRRCGSASGRRPRPRCRGRARCACSTSPTTSPAPRRERWSRRAVRRAPRTTPSDAGAGFPAPPGRRPGRAPAPRTSAGPPRAAAARPQRPPGGVRGRGGCPDRARWPRPAARTPPRGGARRRCRAGRRPPRAPRATWCPRARLARPAATARRGSRATRPAARRRGR